MKELPLAEKRMVVTRPQRQSASLADALRRLGAQVIEAPAIVIAPPADPRPLDEAIARIERYDWVVFTSANGVEAFFERLWETRPEASMTSLRFAAIGPRTAESLSERGHQAEVVPSRFVAEEVFHALEKRTLVRDQRFLLPRADIAREALPDLLRRSGALVDVVVAYRTLPATEDVRRASELVRRSEVDLVTFTSASTVRSFFAGLDPSLRGRVAAASIGPVTSRALRELGVEPAVEAETYTVQGLVEAIARHFQD